MIALFLIRAYVSGEWIAKRNRACQSSPEDQATNSE